MVLRFAPLLVVGVLILGMTSMGRSQLRLQTDFSSRMDSLHLKGMPHQLLDEMRKRGGYHESPSALRKVANPQSQFYVIDTVVAMRTTDTMRYLYGYNASAKTTQELQQTLKSGLWVDTVRVTYTYDARMNMLTHFSEYSANGKWEFARRWTYTYDEGNRMLTHLAEDLWQGQWDTTRWTYTYDQNGYLVALLYERQQGGVWRYMYLYTYTNDAAGNELTRIYQLTAGSNGQWQNMFYDSSGYDGSGNPVFRLSKEWKNDQWVNSERSSTTYTNDATGHMESELIEAWVSGQWVSSTRYAYTYDANGNYISWLREDWSNGQWVNYSRYTHTYDGNGNRLTRLYEEWSNGQWVNSKLYTYTYDVKGNLASFSSDSWLSNSWTPTDATLTLTDSAGNGILNYRGYHVAFTYRLLVTGVSLEDMDVPLTCSLLQNYPNPFNPSTTIRYELPNVSMVRLSVFDILGREVAVLVNEKKNAGVYEVEFDASGLASGAYFYRMRAGDYVETRKLLLLH